MPFPKPITEPNDLTIPNPPVAIPTRELNEFIPAVKFPNPPEKIFTIDLISPRLLKEVPILKILLNIPPIFPIDLLPVTCPNCEKEEAKEFILSKASLTFFNLNAIACKCSTSSSDAFFFCLAISIDSLKCLASSSDNLSKSILCFS